MIYVVTDSGVITGRNLNEINKILKSQIDLDELTVVGSDRFINMTNKDIDFVQDKRKMSRIFFGNFFRSDTKAIKIMTIAILALSIISLLLDISTNQQITKLVEILTRLNGG